MLSLQTLRDILIYMEYIKNQNGYSLTTFWNSPRSQPSRRASACSLFLHCSCVEPGQCATVFVMFICASHMTCTLIELLMFSASPTEHKNTPLAKYHIVAQTICGTVRVWLWTLWCSFFNPVTWVCTSKQGCEHVQDVVANGCSTTARCFIS